MIPPLKSILHVDDEPDLRNLVAMTLTTLGPFRVRSCASGLEAIDAARATRPDLIVLDVMMPGLDGLGTLEQLRAEPDTRAIPAAFMTAKPAESANLRALGACAIIAKPFDPVQLCDQLRAIWQTIHTSRAVPPANAVGDLEVLPHSRFAELIARFARRAADSAEELSALAERDDATAIHRMRELAHMLAGSGASFGYPELSAAAADVEAAASEFVAFRGSAPDRLASAVGRLRQSLAQVNGGRLG